MREKPLYNLYAVHGNSVTLRAESTNGLGNRLLFNDSGVQAGDFLLFGTNNNFLTGYRGLRIDLALPIQATSISGKWQYARPTTQREVGDTTSTSAYVIWEDLVNVRDNTVNLTVAGSNTVTWDYPEDWGNFANPGNQIGNLNSTQGVDWYRWYVRFLITEVTGLTEGGATSPFDVTGFFWAISADAGDTFSCEDLYQADRAGQVILENRSGISSTDSSPQNFIFSSHIGEGRVGGGNIGDLNINVTNFTGITSAEIWLIGFDPANSLQLEVVPINGNGTYPTTNYWQKIYASQVISIVGTGSFDYTVTQDGWGVVHKQGESQYYFECGFDFAEDSIWQESQTNILVKRACHPVNYAQLEWGELIGGVGVKGVSLIIDGANQDYSGHPICGRNSKVYNTAIRFKELPVVSEKHQGAWGGGVADHENQDFNGFHIDDLRNAVYRNPDSSIINCTAWNGQIEGSGAIISNCSHVGAFSIRCANNDFGSVYHNIDVTASTWSSISGLINPWQCDLTPGFYQELRDGIWPLDSSLDPTVQVRWRNSSTASTNIPSNGAPSFYATYSLLVRLVDVSGTPITNATMRVLDTNLNLLMTIQNNSDGYFGQHLGVVDSIVQPLSGLTELYDSTVTSANAYSFGQVLFTSGNSFGERKFIEQNHPVGTFKIAPSFKNTPTAGDRYIVIPYVRSRRFEPATSNNGSNVNSAIEDFGPFRIEIDIDGFESFVINTPINSSNRFEQTIKLSGNTAINVLTGQIVGKLNEQLVIS